MGSRKQHRRGNRITRIESQLAAIAEHIGDNSCSGCFATLTDADSEAGKCTQCGTPITVETELKPHHQGHPDYYHSERWPT